VPLRDDLLNPIAGDNPSGPSLRYERVYDQIKEARTEEDDTIPAGAWQRTAKRADFVLVIKLAGEALATKSKDLQLAAWLAEAHAKREGLSMIQPSLKLGRTSKNSFAASRLHARVSFVHRRRTNRPDDPLINWLFDE